MKTSIFLLLSLIVLSLCANDRIVHAKVGDLPYPVKESSGLVVVDKATIWTHSDSGYDNELYLVDSNGVLLRTVVVGNATNVDWEDLAFDLEGNLWINDAGNNSNARKNLRLYRINKDDLASSDLVDADQIIDFSYPDQQAFPPQNSNMNFDIEGMFCYQDSVYLITKNRSKPTNGYAKLYALPMITGTYVASLIDSFFVEEDMTRSRITAADFYVPTNKMAMLTRTQVIEFWNFPGRNIFAGEYKRYFFKSRTNQVEALGFVDEHSFYMTDEGSPANQVPGSWYLVQKENSLNSVGENRWFELSVHWSPYQNQLHLQTHQNDIYLVEVYSLNGNLVIQTKLEQQLNISTQYLSKGVYVVKITNSFQQLYTTKFMIH